MTNLFSCIHETNIWWKNEQKNLPFIDQRQKYEGEQQPKTRTRKTTRHLKIHSNSIRRIKERERENERENFVLMLNEWRNKTKEI